MSSHEEIAKVAYELWEKNGRPEGRNLENWLEAERIVAARLAGKKEARTALPRQPQKEPARAEAPKKGRGMRT